MWSAKEDKVLIDCLLTLKVEQKWMADNGFKAGFANALQSMMEQKLPGCGIKATPHITSRIKTLKRLWQLAYDMVYGPNTSDLVGTGHQICHRRASGLGRVSEGMSKALMCLC
ncbi:hypothetical protein K1719_040405 [Acacia pycnantha]|nr:hypothetical protein K1719_040405 [Acacia pycnantha]